MLITILVLGIWVVGSTVLAQCPMCSMAAESNLENGGHIGRGLNAGILYMFAAPYVIVGFLTYMWWKNRKSDDEA